MFSRNIQVLNEKNIQELQEDIKFYCYTITIHMKVLQPAVMFRRMNNKIIFNGASPAASMNSFPLRVVSMLFLVQNNKIGYIVILTEIIGYTVKRN